MATRSGRRWVTSLAVGAALAADPTSNGTVTAPGLVWSPGAQPGMVAQIDRARISVVFTSEELTDRAAIATLESDAAEG